MRFEVTMLSAFHEKFLYVKAVRACWEECRYRGEGTSYEVCHIPFATFTAGIGTAPPFFVPEYIDENPLKSI